MDTLKVLVYKIFLKVLVYKIFLKINKKLKKKKKTNLSVMKTFMKVV